MLAAIAAMAFVHWIAGVALLLALLSQRLAPLDFFVAYFVVVAWASFIDYTQGHLTAQLSLLSLALVFMLYCYLIARRRRLLALRTSPLTLPLLLYLALTFVNVGRGLLAGNSMRFGGLELLAALGLGSSFLLAATRLSREQVRLGVIGLVLLSVAHLVWGLSVYEEAGKRVGSLSFTPVPGVVAMIIFNLGLRARTRTHRLLAALVLAPLVVHQFISFTRGYWLSTAVGFAFSLWIFAGRGHGSAERWKRSAAFGLSCLVLFVIGAVAASLLLGYSNVGVETVRRFTSAFGTEIEYETGSNFVRLSEYLTASDWIRRAPWFGHGLGFSFIQIEPFSKQVYDQWFVHNNYLLVWLKQGIVGLFLFVWLLLAGVRLGLKGRNLGDPLLESWCVGTAAGSMYCIAYSLVHFPLAEVNTVFTIALLWGVSASILGGKRWILIWNNRSGPMVSAVDAG